MIRVTCPHCGSKPNAKDELAGQTRRCPNSAQPIRIVADAPADPDRGVCCRAPSDERSSLTRESACRVPLLDRLHRDCHYLICDKARLVAAWENNGQGWMLKTNAGSSAQSGTATSFPTRATSNWSN